MSALARREFIINGSAALAALAVFQSRFARAFPSRPGETVIAMARSAGGKSRSGDNQNPARLGGSGLMGDAQRQVLQHRPFRPAGHRRQQLEAGDRWPGEETHGADARRSQGAARQKVTFTVECSGNHGFPFFTGGIGNAQWTGTPLAALLEEAGVKENGIEVVFWGTDVGDIELKERNVKMHQNFARSMSLAEAMNSNNILCYEMNGAALPAPNGFPLRLIAPGWYGIANVKWLKRIEVRDRPFRNQFMARDYVTIREEDHNGETVWAETSVGRSLLKSAPARVTQKDNSYRITGAAWGAPISKVEVKIDDGPWLEATIDHSEEAEFAWKIWHLDWEKPAPGEHTVTSRAIDASGQIQPAMDDPWIAKKKTYWESNGQVTRRIKIS